MGTNVPREAGSWIYCDKKGNDASSASIEFHLFQPAGRQIGSLISSRFERAAVDQYGPFSICKGEGPISVLPIRMYRREKRKKKKEKEKNKSKRSKVISRKEPGERVIYTARTNKTCPVTIYIERGKIQNQIPRHRAPNGHRHGGPCRPVRPWLQVSTPRHLSREPPTRTQAIR